MDEISKKLHDLEQEKKIREALDAEREHIQETYAVKLAERAIFSLIGLLSVGVVSVLIKISLNYINVIFK